MIELDEKIVAVWFLATIPGHQDWMAGMREIVPNETYKITYRFRYYTGDQSKNPFDAEDKKNWYEGEVSGTRAYCIASLRGVAALLLEASKATNGDKAEPLYEIINDGGVEKFMRELANMPFAYVRQGEPS